MAKGNLFHGLGRGKVGDVVLYRKNGEQISRVRVRHISNPKTTKQQIQRAIMATIMQAYSAGKEIFDHSFEGKKVGAENMARFMSVNAKNLRSILGTEINSSADATTKIARFVAPGVDMPVPTPLIVSQGSYAQRAFSITQSSTEAEEGHLDKVTYALPAPVAGETAAVYAARVGLIAGDLYTFVSFATDGNLEDIEPVYQAGITYSVYEDVYPCLFTFLRLQVKSNIAELDTAVTAETPLSTLFDVTASDNVLSAAGDEITRAMAQTINNVSGAMMTGHPGSGFVGLIRSRLDADLRSNTQMLRFGLEGYGINSAKVSEVWSKEGDSIGNPEVILEGGNF